jgi:hypothetical protein
MDGTNGRKEMTRAKVQARLSALSVNIFTAPGKAMVGGRPKPFGEPLDFDRLQKTATSER